VSSSHIDKRLGGGEIVGRCDCGGHTGGPFSHHLVEEGSMVRVLLIILKQFKPEDMAFLLWSSLVAFPVLRVARVAVKRGDDAPP
jgi:hypothetical protein